MGRSPTHATSPTLRVTLAAVGAGEGLCIIVHRSVHYRATLDRTFFALSDPTRRRILERLGHGPATIGELAKPFGLTINGVKKHVGVLEEVDLVVTTKVGRARKCRTGAGAARGRDGVDRRLPAQLAKPVGPIRGARRETDAGQSAKT